MTWTSKSSFNFARYQHGAGQFKDCGYIFGGLGDAGITTGCEKYSMQCDGWTEETSTTFLSKSYFAFASGYNGLWVFGGYGVGPVNPSYTLYFDPLTSTWQTMALLSSLKYHWSASRIKDSFLTFGGYNNSRDVFRYSPSSDSWNYSAETPLSIGSQDHGSVSLYNKTTEYVCKLRRVTSSLISEKLGSISRDVEVELGAVSTGALSLGFLNEGFVAYCFDRQPVPASVQSANGSTVFIGTTPDEDVSGWSVVDLDNGRQTTVFQAVDGTELVLTDSIDARTGHALLIKPPNEILVKVETTFVTPIGSGWDRGSFPTFRLFAGVADPSWKFDPPHKSVEVNFKGFAIDLEAVPAYKLAIPWSYDHRVPALKVVDCDGGTSKGGIKKLKLTQQETEDLKLTLSVDRYHEYGMHAFHYRAYDNKMRYGYGSWAGATIGQDVVLKAADQKTITAELRKYPGKNSFVYIKEVPPKKKFCPARAKQIIVTAQLEDGPEVVVKPYLDYVVRHDGSEITQDVVANNPTQLFDAAGNALYLGDWDVFDSLDFELLQQSTGVTVTWYYSVGNSDTGDGVHWKELNVTDDTQKFSFSGRVYFEAPQDWVPSNLNVGGKIFNDTYWIKIVPQAAGITVSEIRRHVTVKSKDLSLTFSWDPTVDVPDQETIDVPVAFVKDEFGNWTPATIRPNVTLGQLVNLISRMANVDRESLNNEFNFETPDLTVSSYGSVPVPYYKYKAEVAAGTSVTTLIGVGPEVWSLSNATGLVKLGELPQKHLPFKLYPSGYQEVAPAHCRRLWIREGSEGLEFVGAAWIDFEENFINTAASPSGIELGVGSRRSVFLELFRGRGLTITDYTVRQNVNVAERFFRKGHQFADDTTVTGHYSDATTDKVAGENLAIPYPQVVFSPSGWSTKLYYAAGLTGTITPNTSEGIAWEFQYLTTEDHPHGTRCDECPAGHFVAFTDYPIDQRIVYSIGQQGFVEYCTDLDAVMYFKFPSDDSLTQVLELNVVGSTVYELSHIRLPEKDIPDAYQWPLCGYVDGLTVYLAYQAQWEDELIGNYSYVTRFTLGHLDVDGGKIDSFDYVVYCSEGTTFEETTLDTGDCVHLSRLNDAIYLGDDREFVSSWLNISSSDFDGVIEVEYWDGLTWTHFPTLRDETLSLQQSGHLTVSLPRDWTKVDLNTAAGISGLDPTPRFYTRVRVSLAASAGHSATVTQTTKVWDVIWNSKYDVEYLTPVCLTKVGDYVVFGACDKKFLHYWLKKVSLDSGSTESLLITGFRNPEAFALVEDECYVILGDRRTGRRPVQIAKVNLDPFGIDEVTEVKGSGYMLLGPPSVNGGFLRFVTGPEPELIEFSRSHFIVIPQLPITNSVRVMLQNVAQVSNYLIEVDPYRTLRVVPREYARSDSHFLTFEFLKSVGQREFLQRFDGVKVEWKYEDRSGSVVVGLEGPGSIILEISNPLIQDPLTAALVAAKYLKYWHKRRRLRQVEGSWLAAIKNFDRVKLVVPAVWTAEDVEYQVVGMEFDLRNLTWRAKLIELLEGES